MLLEGPQRRTTEEFLEQYQLYKDLRTAILQNLTPQIAQTMETMPPELKPAILHKTVLTMLKEADKSYVGHLFINISERNDSVDLVNEYAAYKGSIAALNTEIERTAIRTEKAERTRTSQHTVKVNSRYL